MQLSRILQALSSAAKFIEKKFDNHNITMYSFDMPKTNFQSLTVSFVVERKHTEDDFWYIIPKPDNSFFYEFDNLEISITLSAPFYQEPSDVKHDKVTQLIEVTIYER